MKSPPNVIDGAHVLQTADISVASPTGRTRHVAAGQEVADLAVLAIARYDNDSGVYLIYCDSEWNVVTDTYHDTIEGAVAQAAHEFGPLLFSGPNPDQSVVD